MVIDEYFKNRRGVLRVAACVLHHSAGTWAFAQEHQLEIGEHWRKRQAESPGLFDGRVMMMRPPAVADQVLSAELIAIDFKAYLFWRESGFPEAGVFDGFGSALIRSAEGHVLLGRQRGGNINAGLAYLPGGFIDGRDISDDGFADIDASVARELAEETGLSTRELNRVPGYVITVFGRQISIALEYRSPLAATALRSKILTAIAGQAEPELEDIVIVTDAEDTCSEVIAEYVRVLLPSVFSAPS